MDINTVNRLENIFDPKVSKSLPDQTGVYIKVIYKHQAPSSRNYTNRFATLGNITYIEGIVYLIPEHQRSLSYNKEYGFRPLLEKDSKFLHIIEGLSLSQIDKRFELINGDSTQYPLQDGDNIIGA
jgi:hypothetical protein